VLNMMVCRFVSDVRCRSDQAELLNYLGGLLQDRHFALGASSAIVIRNIQEFERLSFAHVTITSLRHISMSTLHIRRKSRLSSRKMKAELVLVFFGQIQSILGFFEFTQISEFLMFSE
jgi:hypothetical protein